MRRDCIVDRTVYPQHKPAEGMMINPSGVREMACWCARCGVLLDPKTGKEMVRP